MEKIVQLGSNSAYLNAEDLHLLAPWTFEFWTLMGDYKSCASFSADTILL